MGNLHIDGNRLGVIERAKQTVFGETNHEIHFIHNRDSFWKICNCGLHVIGYGIKALLSRSAKGDEKQSQKPTCSEEIEMKPVETTQKTDKTQITEQDIKNIIDELNPIKSIYDLATDDSHIECISKASASIDNAKKELQSGNIELCCKHLDTAISWLSNKILPKTTTNNMPSKFVLAIQELRKVQSKTTYVIPGGTKKYKELPKQAQPTIQETQSNETIVQKK